MSPSALPAAATWQALVPHRSSITYRWAGDVRVLLAAGYALLLQVSHPTVGAGVSEHSQFRRDPWGRLFRTLDYACTMVYGGPRAAGEMGVRIRSLHRQIYGTGPQGRRYHALEPEAYAWVHATLADAIVLAHERFGRPLNERERECLWSEWRTLGRLLGVGERDLPERWPAFREYFEEMVQVRLQRTAAVDEVLAALASPAAPSPGMLPGLGWALLRPPLGHGLVLASVGLLPATLRRRFAVRWSAIDELQLTALGAILRAITPLMPPWLQNTGPGYLRMREQAIAGGELPSAVP